jgi:hypothetical protein
MSTEVYSEKVNPASCTYFGLLDHGIWAFDNMGFLDLRTIGFGFPVPCGFLVSNHEISDFLFQMTLKDNMIDL